MISYYFNFVRSGIGSTISALLCFALGHNKNFCVKVVTKHSGTFTFRPVRVEHLFSLVDVCPEQNSIFCFRISSGCGRSHPRCLHQSAARLRSRDKYFVLFEALEGFDAKSTFDHTMLAFMPKLGCEIFIAFLCGVGRSKPLCSCLR